MSTTSIESEVTLYIRIDDASELVNADLIENHLQLENLLVTGAKIRVRKITPIHGGEMTGDRYELTLKDKCENDAGVPSSYETNQETDRNFYAAFSETANRAITKRRYKIIGSAPTITGVETPVALPALVYEVDRFVVPSTKQFSNWVKLDIELGDMLTALREQGVDTSEVRQKIKLSILPFKSEEIIDPENMTPEQKETLGKLWENEFALVLKEPTYVKSSGPK